MTQKIDKNHGVYSCEGVSRTLSNGHTVSVGNLIPSDTDTNKEYKIGIRLTRPDSEKEGETLVTKFAITLEAAEALVILLMKNNQLRDYTINKLTR